MRKTNKTLLCLLVYTVIIFFLNILSDRFQRPVSADCKKMATITTYPQPPCIGYRIMKVPHQHDFCSISMWSGWQDSSDDDDNHANRAPDSVSMDVTVDITTNPYTWTLDGACGYGGIGSISMTCVDFLK